MMNFTPFVNDIKDSFTKEQLKTFEQIKDYKNVQLASMGSNDTEGYQIFTPDFIVKQMIEAVGDDILDFDKTILEPTSGDGAFTTYIYRKRLETINDNFEINSLKALSTIYSIEMDKELIIKQRDNIYTLAKLFIEDNHIEVDDSYYEMLKCMITTNFIWAMFNSDREIDAGFFGAEVAYKMPEAEKHKLKSISFPVWDISENNVEIHYEEAEII